MEEEKTKINFLELFGIVIGKHYHALDIAVQTAYKAYELYIKAPKEEKEIHWIMATTVAKYMNPPVPIEAYNPNFIERKYQKN